MNIDDVSCVTVLTAVVVSIGVAAATFLGEEASRKGVAVAQCPHAHPTASIVTPRNG